MNKVFKRTFFILTAVLTCSITVNSKILNVKADEIAVDSVTQETSAEIGGISADSVWNSGIIEETESVTQNENNSVVEDSTGITVEDFLGIMQDKADEYGVGEEFSEWKETLNNIKYAVKEKKFDTLFWWSIGQTILIAVYIVYKVIKNVSIGKLSIEIKNLSSLISKLTDTENQLVDDAKRVEKEEEDIKKQQKNIAKAMECTNEALGYMVDGINFTPEKKTAAARKLNKANKYLEEGAKHDVSTQ
jgi:hypothetical protein